MWHKGGRERANASVGSPVARWRTWPRAHQPHWLLRLGVIGCCLGHGAYGVLTKEAWVPYGGVGVRRTSRQLWGAPGFLGSCRYPTRPARLVHTGVAI